MALLTETAEAKRKPDEMNRRFMSLRPGKSAEYLVKTKWPSKSNAVS